MLHLHVNGISVTLNVIQVAEHSLKSLKSPQCPHTNNGVEHVVSMVYCNIELELSNTSEIFVAWITFDAT